MDMEQIQYIITIGGLVVFPLVLLLHWLLTWKRRREMMGQAEVLSKTPELALGSGAFGNNNWNYKVQFRVGSAEFFLYALQCDYDVLEPGMTGTLVWQEENLISFTPNEE